MDKSLSNVRNRVSTATTRGSNFRIVCGFSIKNKQLSPFAANAGDVILNLRYWSTEPFQAISFNDFIYFSLRKSILKRVINNGLTGSYWHFNLVFVH